jgi:hypothetical protein
MSDTPSMFDTDVLPLFEEHRADWLAEARATAVSLAIQRGTVTIDDVRDHCPPPDDVDPRVMGAVFRTSDFESTGRHVRSVRRTCHNRPVMVFKLRGAA